MARKRLVQTSRLVAGAGPYDEMPVLPEEVDPQLCLSRNDRQQPFFLICQRDCVLLQLSGRALIEFKASSVLHFNAVPGDYIYVPAATPHRISPVEEAIHYRYKAAKAGLEAVAWFCENCNAELHRVTWDTSEELPQEGYLRATTAFNEEQELRKCRVCGTAHPQLDLTGFRWKEIVRELRAEKEGAETLW